MRRAVKQLWRHRRGNTLAVVLGALLIAVLYALGALSENHALADAAATAMQVTAVVPAGLTLVMLLLLAFTVTFQFYLERALWQRRRQEFGVARLLGLSANRLGGRLVLEALVRQAVTLVLGLSLGVVVSKLLAMAMVRLMGLHVTTGLLWSPLTMLELSVTLMVVAALQGLLDALAVRGRDLTPWLRPLPVTALPTRRGGRWRGLLGAGLMIMGWVVMLGWRPLLSGLPQQNRQWGGLGLLVVILSAWLIGTYWVIRDGLPLWLTALQRRHQGRWLISTTMTLTTIASRLRGHAHSLWLTTILASVTMTVLGSASMVYGVATSAMNRAVVAPVVVTAQTKRHVLAALPQAPTRELTTKLVVGRLTGGATSHLGLYQVMAASDYLRLRRAQPSLPALQLTGRQAMVMTTRIGQVQRRFGERHRPHQISLARGPQVQVAQATNQFPLGQDVFFDRGLVVTDAVFAQVVGTTDRLWGLYPAATAATRRAVNRLARGDAQLSFVANTAAVRAGRQLPQLATVASGRTWSRDAAAYRAPVRAAGQTLFGFGLFLALLAGTVVVVATASILLLKLVIAADGSQAELAVLRQLGLPATSARRITWQTVGGVFALPLLIGVADAVVTLVTLHNQVAEPSGGLAAIVITVYIVVFLGFAWMTGRLIDQLSLVGRSGPED